VAGQRIGNRGGGKIQTFRGVGRVRSVIVAARLIGASQDFSKCQPRSGKLSGMFSMRRNDGELALVSASVLLKYPVG